MKLWMSGALHLGAMLLALLALAQWPALADNGLHRVAPPVRQAAAGEVPAHLGWMLEQHWRVVSALQ